MNYSAFLAGTCRDARARHINDILRFTPDKIEENCTFLQWVFPTHEPSPIEPGAWTLTTADIYAINRSYEALKNHNAALSMMRHFYILHNTSWLTIGDHNHKRITRIITNISLVHGVERARGFYDIIMFHVSQVGNPINPTTLEFWRKAAAIR
jgi:hypothetical protein